MDAPASAVPTIATEAAFALVIEPASVLIDTDGLTVSTTMFCAMASALTLPAASVAVADTR